MYKFVERLVVYDSFKIAPKHPHRYTPLMAKYTYKFCPQCGMGLTSKMIMEQVRPACPSCDFIHFEDPKVAVVAFITCQGRVLLIQRAVDPEKGKWAMPGGYMDAGEIPEEALKREMLEEIGLDIEITQLIGTRSLFYTNSDGAQENVGIVLVYNAGPKSGHLEQLFSQDDVMNAGWFLPDETPESLAFEITGELLEEWRSSEVAKQRSRL